MHEFELAILRTVAEAGGEASRLKVVEVLGRALDDRLTDVDRGSSASSTFQPARSS